MSIRFFSEINDSHAATGYSGRTDLPAFHIFTLEDTYPETRQVMLPYRFGFYQIVLLENSDDATLDINTEAVRNLDDTLAFASPDHVLAWVRGAQQRGFILYFKEEFLAPFSKPVPDEFPYFRMTELNVVRVHDEDKRALREHLQRLLDVFRAAHPYRVEILRALLLALLYENKRVYDAQQHTLRRQNPRAALVFRFQQFVNQHFLTRKTVEAYAELLSVSSDHLSQTIRQATGRTAYSFIAERTLLEAKTLLSYSDLNVAEIADYLGYAEPTHFGRFFRRHIGVSPLAWRQTQSRGSSR